MKKILMQLLCLLSFSFIEAQHKESVNVQNSVMNAPVAPQKTGRQFFIENKGQWPEEVLYKAGIGGVDLWITSQGVVYDFYKMRNKSGKKTISPLQLKDQQHERSIEKFERYGQVVKMTLQNANRNPGKIGIEKSNGYYNYLLGKDRSKWADHVGLYGEAIVKDIYEGIDVRYYYENGQIRYDYIVQPGADVSRIRMAFAGVEQPFVNRDVELAFNTRFGEVKQAGLYSYQVIDGRKEKVESRFRKNRDGAISFEVDHYNKELPLIIDPLIYSTFIGGTNGSETGNSLAVDASGNAYITGTTYSSDFPMTPGAYDYSVYNGYADLFVTKLNSTGSQLVYSTFIGGTYQDEGVSIAVDETGCAYITGFTESFDYPTTAGAFDQTLNNVSDCQNGYCYFDIFVTKFNSTGSALVYSTLMGGGANQAPTSISVDGAHNIYITGNTNSSDFPVTPGSFDVTYGGVDYDVFVVKLNNTGSALLYSTFLGGGYAFSITSDANGNAYVTGYTYFPEYPITPGAFDATLEGGDAFVTKLNSAGSGLVYSTFIGGTSVEMGRSIAIDQTGNAYITGHTTSVDFPVTPGAYDGLLNGDEDVFVTKLNSNGSSLIFSSFLGGGSIEEARSLSIDGSGNTYVTGVVYAVGFSDFPVTPQTFDATSNGEYDVFVSMFNSTGSALLYSTFLGGSSMDDGNAIVAGTNGQVYVAGTTTSANYPTSPGAYDQTLNNWHGDAFVTKLEVTLNTTFSFTPVSNSPVCAGKTVYLTVFPAGGTAPYTYSWTGPNGFSSTQQNPSINNVSAAANGVYSVSVTDANGNSGSATTTVTTIPSPMASISASSPSCTTGCITLTASGGASYKWSNESTSTSITACYSGTFFVTAFSNEGCTDNDTITVVKGTPFQAPTITQSAPACGTGCITLTASAGASYLWSTGSTSSSINACAAGTYSVQVSNGNGCSGTAQVTLGPPVTCAAPTQSATTNITLNAARFNWQTNNCATGYQVQYRKTGTTTWTIKNISGNIGYTNINGLKKQTTYEWQVRTQCFSNSVIYSPFTGLVTFTTSSAGARRDSETLVNTVEQPDNKTPGLTVYPNPASQQLTVNVDGYDGRWQLYVINSLGRRVISRTVDLNGREVFSINIEALAQGIYRVMLANDSVTVTGKFIKDK